MLAQRARSSLTARLRPARCEARCSRDRGRGYPGETRRSGRSRRAGTQRSGALPCLASESEVFRRIVLALAPPRELLQGLRRERKALSRREGRQLNLFRLSRSAGEPELQAKGLLDEARDRLALPRRGRLGFPIEPVVDAKRRRRHARIIANVRFLVLHPRNQEHDEGFEGIPDLTLFRAAG